MLLEAGNIQVLKTKANSFSFGVSQFDLKSRDLLKAASETNFSISVELSYLI